MNAGLRQGGVDAWTILVSSGLNVVLGNTESCLITCTNGLDVVDAMQTVLDSVLLHVNQVPGLKHMTVSTECKASILLLSKKMNIMCDDCVLYPRGVSMISR